MSTVAGIIFRELIHPTKPPSCSEPEGEEPTTGFAGFHGMNVNFKFESVRIKAQNIPLIRVHQIRQQKSCIKSIRRENISHRTKNRFIIIKRLTGWSLHTGNFSAMISDTMRPADFCAMCFVPRDRPLQAFLKLHLCLKPELLPRPAHIQTPFGLAIGF